MSILIVKLCLVFAAVIAILWMKRPLPRAIPGGLAVVLALYSIRVPDILSITGRPMVSKDAITVVLGSYFITFLQHTLECRDHLKQTEQSLNWLSNNRRVNTSAASAIVGPLPSTGAMTIRAETVGSSCQDYLSNEDITYATNFYYYVPKSFLFIYSSVLIALATSGVGAGEFALAMLPLVTALFFIGYMFYLGKVSRSMGQKTEEDGKEAVIALFKSLWSIISVVVLTTAFDIPAYVATPIAVILNIFTDHLRPWEIKPMLRTTFEPIIIFNTILIMMFGDITTHAGVIHELSVFFGGLPIPLPMVFVLIFFFDTIISGSNAIISLCILTAMATMPDAGAPPLVSLMSSAYAVMQVSPIHVYLFIVAECFKADIGVSVRRNISIILVFFAVISVYTTPLGVL